MINTSKRSNTIKQINNVVISDFKGALFIWGPKSSGKYTTIKHVLESNSKIYCEADCNDHYSTTSLFRALLSTLRNIDNQLDQQHDSDNENDEDEDEEERYKEYNQHRIQQKEYTNKLNLIKNNNLGEMFTNMINQGQVYAKKIPLSVTPSVSEMIKVLYEKASTKKTISIILRHSEKLMKFERDFFYSLYKIEEFTECPVCIYMLSEIPKERIVSVGKEFKPIRSIHFTQYDPTEICTIVLNFLPNFDQEVDQQQEDEDQEQQQQEQDEDNKIYLSNEQHLEFYTKLIELVVRIFYTTTKDIIDIIFVCHNLYPLYILPIINGTIQLSNQNLDSTLYKNINPSILKSLLNITEKNQIILDGSGGSGNNLMAGVGNDTFNIPYHMKIILISSFLASSYAKSKDKLLYTKEAVKRQSASSDSATGSKWFFYQRACEIGYKLFPIEKKSKSFFNENIFKTLVSLRYLEKPNSIEPTFSRKFKCSRKVTYDFISQISKSISFNIDSYIEAAQFTNK